MEMLIFAVTFRKNIRRRPEVKTSGGVTHTPSVLAQISSRTDAKRPIYFGDILLTKTSFGNIFSEHCLSEPNPQFFFKYLRFC